MRDNAARAKSRQGAQSTVPAVTILTLADNYLTARDHAEKTRRHYEYARRLLERFAPGPIEEQTAGTCQRAYDSILEAHRVHAADQATKLARAAWAWSARRGDAPTLNPWASIEKRRKHVRPLYFESGWLPAMLRVVDAAIVSGEVPAHAGRFLALALGTGARPWCELLPVRCDDVDLGAGLILIKRSKGGRPRTIPTAILGDVGRQILEAQLELAGEGWLWPSTRGGCRMSAASIRKHWPTLLDLAEAKGLRTRDLTGKRLDIYSAGRHAVAHFAVAQLGLSIAHVAAILGHRSEETLKTYAHLHVVHATPTAEKLGAAFDQGRGVVTEARYGADPAKLLRARHQAHLSQEQAGELAGVSKSQWSKWERSIGGGPGLEQLHRFACALGLELPALLHAGGRP